MIENLKILQPLQTDRGRTWPINAHVDVPGYNRPQECRVGEVYEQGVARLFEASPRLLATLRNVLGHNAALKAEYQLPDSLVREIEGAIAYAERAS